MSTARPKVLYIVYWGAAEQLGQSLVLPVMKNLSAHADMTLLTFEKPADLARHGVMLQIEHELDAVGARWIRLRYHKRPRVPATAFDVLQGVAASVAARRHGPFDIVHARTYVGGLVGLIASSMLGARLVYHNEGFYPDEMVDGGEWARGSRVHRLMKRIDDVMYRRADGLVVLSERAKAAIGHQSSLDGKPVAVMPSCVDLNAFAAAAAAPPSRNGALTLVYLGAIGPRYRFENAARFVRFAITSGRDVRFRVLTRTPPEIVQAMCSAAGLPEERYSIEALAYPDVPAALADAHVGLSFIRSGIALYGISPTKTGEYWAAGLPVVATPDAGDTDHIIRRERVGVVVEGDSETAYCNALRELESLMTDADLRGRCRQAAERHYSVDTACDRLRGLYHSLLDGSPARTVPGVP
jgi:glycosyltransferase involved in cell wall biosynthesis